MGGRDKSKAKSKGKEKVKQDIGPKKPGPLQRAFCFFKKKSSVAGREPHGDPPRPETGELNLVDVNATDEHGNTVLILALQSRNKKLIKAVLAHQPNMLASNQNGDSALMWAIEIQYWEIIPILLKMGADPNQENKLGSTPILFAAFQGNYELVKVLLESGGTLSTTSRTKRTLLHFATAKAFEKKDQSPLSQANQDFIAYLLEKGLDVNQKDLHEMTPLMYAATSGYISVIDLLLDQGADLEALNEKGWSPLLIAAMSGHPDLVKKFIEAGANIHVVDRTGKGIFHLLQFETPSVTALLDLDKQSLYAAAGLPGLPSFFKNLVEIKARVHTRLQLILKAPTGNEVELEELKLLKYLIQDAAKDVYLWIQEKELSHLHQVKRQCISCLEEKIVNQDQAKGPADCSCLICDECSPTYLKYLIDKDGAGLSLCPGCKGVVCSNYLKSHRVDKGTQLKFLTRQIAFGNVRTSGWIPCKTEGCVGGRSVRPDEEAYYSCAFCDWSACLSCGIDHRGAECDRLGKEEQARQAKLEKLVELGKLISNPAIKDPEDDRYYHGRFRPCYYCGLMTEKNKGCNGMTCRQCGREWNWNHGNKGGHDEARLPQEYEPQFPAHF
jgi:ankyrin repeat protein